MTSNFLSKNFTLLDLNISKSLWCLKHKQARKKINNSPKINQKFSKPCFLISFVALLLKERISKCYLNCHSLLKYLHYELNLPISSVQSLIHVRLFATPWTAARQASLSITNSWSLLKLTSIESVMPSSHLILCRPLLLLPPIPPTIRVFSNESTLRIRWPKYWSFSFSIIPSNEHPRLISFRMDSLDLLAVQGTLKSLLQHHSSKASILRRSAFFTVQLSHPYMTTGSAHTHGQKFCAFLSNLF